MNTTARWSCRLARASISVFGQPARGRGPGSGHVAHCAECRRFLAAVEDVTSRLRADAARNYGFPSTGFDQRVLRALVPAAPAPARRTRPPTIAWVTFAGAAAVLALTITITRLPTTPVDHSQHLTVVPNSGTTAPSVAAAPAAPTDSELIAATETAIDGTTSLLERNPLQSEAESVYADAKGAVRFLALNFLPADTVAKIDATRPQRRNDG